VTYVISVTKPLMSFVKYLSTQFFNGNQLILTLIPIIR